MTLKIGFITVDCDDTLRLAGFWSQALGYENKGGDADWAEIGDPQRIHPPILFQRVPETKAAKNRLHLDLNADDMREEVGRLLNLGATRVHGYDESEQSVVMADPEGNEFCVAHW